MIIRIFQYLLVALAILVFEWKALKEGSRSTRLFTYILLFISGIIWVYIFTTIHVPRPVTYLEKLLAPFNLIQ